MAIRGWIVLPLLVSSILASLLARTQAERHATRTVIGDVRLDFPVDYARIVALEHDATVADFLWIRFIQQVPFKPADDSLGHSLSRQLEGVVALDPSFRSAYVQGTVLLSVLGNQPCSAVEISEKGIERFPGDWRIPFQAGYNCFAEIGDPVCASRHMSHAASLPGAPAWLPALVARLLADASQNDAAIEYLRLQLTRTTDPRLRERFEERLQEAILSAEFARIDAAARRFRVERGALPASIAELVAVGFLAPVPARDPFGGTYELSASGRARSSTGRTGLRTFSRQSAFVGDFSERLFEQRLAARLGTFHEVPPFVRTSMDSLERGLIGEGTSKALAAVQGLLSADDEKQLDLQVLQARAILRRDVDKMRAARLALLREGVRATDLAEIRLRAGVPATDPFGTPYELRDGLPSPGPSRNVLSAVSSKEGTTRCR